MKADEDVCAKIGCPQAIITPWGNLPIDLSALAAKGKSGYEGYRRRFFMEVNASPFDMNSDDEKNQKYCFVHAVDGRPVPGALGIRKYDDLSVYEQGRAKEAAGRKWAEYYSIVSTALERARSQQKL